MRRSVEMRGAGRSGRAAGCRWGPLGPGSRQRSVFCMELGEKFWVEAKRVMGRVGGFGGWGPGGCGAVLDRLGREVGLRVPGSLCCVRKPSCRDFASLLPC